MNPLTDKSARSLARDIVKDSNNVRVKQGTTNGQIVLHVFVPGNNELGRTIKSAAEWDDHPANDRARRNNRFAKEQATEALVEGNKGLST